jgi:predicted DNA-binding transcriptional regulator YafY
MPRIPEGARQQAVERVWLTIKRHPAGITEAEVARFTGLERRTLNNYLRELDDIGKIGKEGTLWFPLDYEETRLRALDLSPEEAYTLYLGSRLLVKQHDKRNEPAEAALLKLAEVLTADAGVGQEIAQAAAELAQRPTRPGYRSVFETLIRGYIYRKRVALRYRPLNGRPFDTHFDTYLLEPSAIGYATYAIGHSHASDALRAYKLERIEEASLTRESYQIPPHFAGLDVLRHAWSIVMGEERIEVVLRFSPRVRERCWRPNGTPPNAPKTTPPGLVICAGRRPWPTPSICSPGYGGGAQSARYWRRSGYGLLLKGR